MRNAYRTWVGRNQPKKPLGRPLPGWEDTIKVDHRDVGFGGLGWFHLDQHLTKSNPWIHTATNFIPRLSQLYDEKCKFARREDLEV
jgi:hypothetical protein